MHKYLLATVAAVALVGPVQAADLAVKAPSYAAPALVSTWTGFYLGANGGWAQFNGSDSGSFGGDSGKATGAVYGGQVGYNHQFGSFVVGVEGDIDGSSLSKSSSGDFTGAGIGAFPGCRGICVGNFIPGSQTEKFDFLSSARAKAGYLVLPNVLLYGTGGVAWGHGSSSFTSTFGNASESLSAVGWVAGAGIDWRVFDRWTVGVDYSHYDFGTVGNAGTDLLVGSQGIGVLSVGAVQATVDTVRAKLNYQF